MDHNEELYPDPVVTGNFIWKDGVQDTEVVFSPDPRGKFNVSWLPKELRNRSYTKAENSLHPMQSWG